MTAAGELGCRQCTHGYGTHDPDGGHCAAVVGGGVVRYGLPCPCPGFRWIPAEAEPHGYSSPPQSP
jgi:hypothetical protein